LRFERSKAGAFKILKLIQMRCSIFCTLIFAGLLCFSCGQTSQGDAVLAEAGPGKKEPLRVGSVTGLKPEKIAYYKELHANTWEGVLKAIKTYNIRNYSIYFKKIEDKYYLFSYYEYTGDDYKSDMKKIAADSITQRWWRETDPCQQPLADAAAEGKIWSNYGRSISCRIAFLNRLT
jgi:L-rhamnose mutarotase